MPYPDDPASTKDRKPEYERISKAEQHLNHLAVGITTIATAILAATLLTAGLGSESRDTPNYWNISHALFSVFAIGIYIFITAFMALTLFPRGNGTAGKLRSRRKHLYNLLSAFIVLVLTATLVMFAATITSLIEFNESTNDIQEQGQESTEMELADPITLGENARGQDEYVLAEASITVGIQDVDRAKGHADLLSKASKAPKFMQ